MGRGALWAEGSWGASRTNKGALCEAHALSRARTVLSIKSVQNQGRGVGGWAGGGGNCNVFKTFPEKHVTRSRASGLGCIPPWAGQAVLCVGGQGPTWGLRAGRGPAASTCSPDPVGSGCLLRISSP